MEGEKGRGKNKKNKLKSRKKRFVAFHCTIFLPLCQKRKSEENTGGGQEDAEE